MKLFPNPASNVVTVNTSDLVEIRLLDVFGRMIRSMNLATGGQTDVDVSSLPSGTYFIEGVQSDGTIYMERLMKH